jgi:UDP-glucose 4-epimerase
MSKFNVVSKIINQIPGDDNLTILTSEPIRDFVWITDVTKGIMELADTGLDKFSKRRVFNISTGVGTSIGEMANLALKIAGESNRKVVSDQTLSRISKNVVDYSVINGLTGWKPTMTLESGLTNLIDSKIKVTN